MLLSYNSISEGGGRNNVRGVLVTRLPSCLIPRLDPPPLNLPSNISLRLININIDVATSLLGRGDLTDLYFGNSPCASSIERDRAGIS